MNKTFDLFIDLGATDEQAHFPVLYASAINGVAGTEPEIEKMKDIAPILDAVVEHLTGPSGDVDAPMQMSIVNIFYDNYKGRIAVGRVVNGVVKHGAQVKHINRDGKEAIARITTLQVYDGLGRKEVASASVGEIVALSGMENVQIGECLVDPVAESHCQ